MSLISSHKWEITTFSFEGATLEASHFAIEGNTSSKTLSLICLAQDFAKTMHSSKELLANLLAPCTPV